MKTFGYIALVIGVIWLLVALNLDTSVDAGYGGRVNNIGLMASKQNHILIGAFVTLCGLLMAIFGKGSQVSMPGTVKCPFCAEMISSEAIKCKHCGSDVSESNKAKVTDIDYGFTPSSLPFDSFFVRTDRGFEINHETIITMVAKLKKINNGVHPRNIITRYSENIEDVKNTLPSGVRDDFTKVYLKHMNK